jgi:hypothetical protein
MAKKAKKAKTTKKAKKATAKKAAPTPTYLAGGRSVDIPADQVAEILATILARGQGAKFKKQAKAAGLVVTVDSKTVNFVKDFLAQNQMHSLAVAKRAINSDGSFNCG